MPSLAAAQENFIATINDGPAVLDQSLFSGPIERVLLGLKAHANTISHARLVALEDSFPLTREAMGDAAFNALSRAFVETPQAQRSDLNDIGRSFPKFVEEQRVEAALCDLAAVEWAWLESYHAAEAAPLTLANIAALSEADLLSLNVRLHPAARLLPLRAALAPPLAHLAADHPAAMLVIRPESEVRLLALDAVTAGIAEKCTDITTIGNLLIHASEQRSEADPTGPVLTLIGAGAIISDGVE